MSFERATTVVAVAFTWSTVAAAQSTTRVSVGPFGEQADQSSNRIAMSLGGRFFAFSSAATNLVANDVNGTSDVFVRDRQTATTVLRSAASNGTQGNAPSFTPAISTDGRYVAFASLATNLVPGDSNGDEDVFVNDRANGITTRVSVDSNGAQMTGPSNAPSISGDGRFVTFVNHDVFVRDRDADGNGVFDESGGVATRIVSTGMAGAAADGASPGGGVSANGRWVAFSSFASNLVPGDTNTCPSESQDPNDFRPCLDVFVRDLVANATVRVSVSTSGAQSNGDSFDPAISADGRFVAFASRGSNFVPGDASSISNVYVHDRDADGDGALDEVGAVATRLVSLGLGGIPATGDSFEPSIASDGRVIAYQSEASNLVAGDTNNNCPQDPNAPAPCSDVFVHDDRDGSTRRISVSSAGTQADDASGSASVSGDGRLVAFWSRATNVVLRDTNLVEDVFVHDRKSCRAGNVNAGAGPVTDVLFVNGSAGDPDYRVVTVAPRSPITVALASSPAGPPGGGYVTWVWRVLPGDQFDLIVSGENIGCTANPTPLRSSPPQPFRCLLGGLGPEYCGSVRQINSAPGTPWSVTRNQGVRGGTFTLQSVVADDGAGNSLHLSVSNAVTLTIH